MNAIENDFLKVIRKNNNQEPYDSCIDEHIATELSGKVERFMNWAFRTQGLIHSGSAEEWQTVSAGSFDTLADLYNYFITNVDNK